jgi:hypothetical protein
MRELRHMAQTAPFDKWNLPEPEDQTLQSWRSTFIKLVDWFQLHCSVWGNRPVSLRSDIVGTYR